MTRYFVNKCSDFKGILEHVDVGAEKHRVHEMIRRIVSHQKLSHSNCDGGLYVGLGGIGYMLYHVAANPAFEEHSKQYLKVANDYINTQLNYDTSVREDESSAAFLLGRLGTLTVAAALAHKLGDPRKCNGYISQLEKYAVTCQPISFLKCGGDELFVGRAGVLCAIYWLQKELGREIVSASTVQKVCDAILDSGVKYSHNHHSSSPLMYAYYGTEYLGAAHGLTAILQMLLCFPNCWTDPNKAKLIKDSIDFLLSLQQSNGNFPCAMDEVGPRSRPASQELVHWCHGAPGVVYLMAKAYLVFKDEKYLDSCVRCADIVWEKGLLKKGPGICHGVAGSGYVFLLLYRLTENQLYLHRARKFSDFMESGEFRTGARTPDCPYSLYEGLAGTTCYLADLLAPERSAFPFFDIF